MRVSPTVGKVAIYKRIAEVLNEMKNICKVYKCKLLITTFPNVENLSSNSKVRSSLLSFSNFMKKSIVSKFMMDMNLLSLIKLEMQVTH